MRARLLGLTLAVLVCGRSGALLGQDARRVSGVVSDGATGTPVGGAIVELAGTGLRTETGNDGRFQLSGVPAGRYALRVIHAAYGTHADTVTVGSADVAFAVRILPRAIRLDPLPVEAAAGERSATSRSYVVTRAQIEALASTARHIGDIVRSYIPGTTMYETRAGYICLEFRGARGARTRGCNFPLVVVDHSPIQAPWQFLRDTPPEEIERIEFVPASAGAARYGLDTQYGALVILTRRSGVSGRPSTAPAAAVVRQPTYIAYQWSQEPGSHPWPRTLLASTLGNVAGVALGLAALGCFGDDGTTGDCLARNDGFAEFAALTLPAVGAAVGARIFGSTPHSRGTGFHSAVAAAIPLLLGFAMYREGASDDFGASRLIGGTLVLVGSPAAAAIADGLFRRPRQR